jgi:hypothetical protein
MLLIAAAWIIALACALWEEREARRDRRETAIEAERDRIAGGEDHAR